MASKKITSKSCKVKKNNSDQKLKTTDPSKSPKVFQLGHLKMFKKERVITMNPYTPRAPEKFSKLILPNRTVISNPSKTYTLENMLKFRFLKAGMSQNMEYQTQLKNLLRNIELLSKIRNLILGQKMLNLELWRY